MFDDNTTFDEYMQKQREKRYEQLEWKAQHNELKQVDNTEDENDLLERLVLNCS